ncbi:uncharacterized protein LOC130014362 [Patella vulgata]|uniref:uncharacterized protein LOC130014362 n=1 Tax=Patella vulgata TaxID=6465 RepID=UPI0024A9F782|nr:uncharacterized protein LOC130014362 [Patella vulgata]
MMDDDRPRRRLRPIRAVTPSLHRGSISMEEFEYLHNKARVEYGMIPGYLPGYESDGLDPEFRSRNRHSQTRQPHDIGEAPPSYDQIEHHQQRQNSTRARGSARNEGSDEPNRLGENQQGLDQSRDERGRPTRVRFNETDEPPSRTRNQRNAEVVDTRQTDIADDYPTDSMEEANPENNPRSKITIGKPVPMIKKTEENAGTSETASVSGTPNKRTDKGSRVIKVEDAEQTKRLKKIALQRKLRAIQSGLTQNICEEGQGPPVEEETLEGEEDQRVSDTSGPGIGYPKQMFEHQEENQEQIEDC